jgi:phosphoglycolate phosphatase
MHFFFDLDGPILDVSDKFYQTYFDILSAHGFNTLDKFHYWELKRNRTPENEIQGLTDAIVNNFGEIRKSIIETDQYQQLDKLQSSAKEVLQVAKSTGYVYLVTLRHSHEQVLKQLDRLGVASLFDAVLSSGEEVTPKWQIKHQLLLKHFNGNIPKPSVFIGDTEADILTGKEINSQTIAVLNGMRNYEKLKQLAPDLIVPSINKLLRIKL